MGTRTRRTQIEKDDKAERKLTDLEDVDLVSLDGVEVVVHGQEDLRENGRGEGFCWDDITSIQTFLRAAKWRKT